MLELVQAADFSTLMWVQENLRGCLNGVMVFYTSLGNHAAIWIVLGFLLCLFRKTRIIGILMLAALCLAYIVNDLALKSIFTRPRPFIESADIIPLVSAAGYSFPSGHACAAFSAAGILCRTVKKEYAVIGLAAAALMAFSRIYTGVHYPTDVIAGILAGLLCSQIVWYGYRYYKESIKI